MDADLLFHNLTFNLHIKTVVIQYFTNHLKIRRKTVCKTLLNKLIVMSYLNKAVEISTNVKYLSHYSLFEVYFSREILLEKKHV